MYQLKACSDSSSFVRGPILYRVLFASPHDHGHHYCKTEMARTPPLQTHVRVDAIVVPCPRRPVLVLIVVVIILLLLGYTGRVDRRGKNTHGTKQAQQKGGKAKGQSGGKTDRETYIHATSQAQKDETCADINKYTGRNHIKPKTKKMAKNVQKRHKTDGLRNITRQKAARETKKKTKKCAGHEHTKKYTHSQTNKNIPEHTGQTRHSNTARAQG